jgi:hypothetical protein
MFGGRVLFDLKGKSENSLARVADSKAEILIYDLVDWYSRPGRPGRPGRLGRSVDLVDVDPGRPGLRVEQAQSTQGKGVSQGFTFFTTSHHIIVTRTEMKVKVRV